MITKLPWRVTGDHSLFPKTASQSGYEDYHVVSGDRVIVEMCARDEAVYIARACNMYPELIEALDGLMNSLSGKDKLCGHDFDCVCPTDRAAAILAKAKEEI